MSLTTTYRSTYSTSNPTHFANTLPKNHSQNFQSNPQHAGMKPHLRNRNIRRVEPDSILRDYRASMNTIYSNSSVKLAAAPIYSTQSGPIHGQEALKKVQERVQKNLMQRGCLVGGKKVETIKKPSCANTVLKSRPTGFAECQSIDNILKNKSTSGSHSSTTKKDCTQAAIKPTLSRAKQTPEGLVLASTAAKAPSKRNVNNQPASAHSDCRQKEKEYVYKDLTTQENKENTVHAENTSRYGHGDTHKLNKRNLVELYKKQMRDERAAAAANSQDSSNADSRSSRKMPQQNNKRGNFGIKSKSSGDNPLQVQMIQKLTPAQIDSSYSTSSGVSYRRWQRSAFQTVTTRNEERPSWANPNAGGHFVRNIPANKKVVSGGINMSVNGFGYGAAQNPKNINRNKKETNVLRQGMSKKSAFISEYQRKFSSAI